MLYHAVPCGAWNLLNHSGLGTPWKSAPLWGVASQSLVLAGTKCKWLIRSAQPVWRDQMPKVVCFTLKIWQVHSPILVIVVITYLPHKAVAEVSKDKEPIGRGACGVQLIRKSIEIRLKWSEIQMILVVNWFGIQVIRLSIDSEFKWSGCRMIWDSSDLVVNWFEIQMIWLSIDVCFKWIWLSVDLRFKWAGCQLIWDSIDLVVNRFEVQMIWLSIDSRFKSWFSIDLRFKWFGC